MFIAALFVRARTWKQRGCPSMEEWIKKVWKIYTLVQLLSGKIQGHLEFCIQMDGNRKHYPE